MDRRIVRHGNAGDEDDFRITLGRANRTVQWCDGLHVRDTFTDTFGGRRLRRDTLATYTTLVATTNVIEIDSSSTISTADSDDAELGAIGGIAPTRNRHQSSGESVSCLPTSSSSSMSVGSPTPLPAMNVRYIASPSTSNSRPAVSATTATTSTRCGTGRGLLIGPTRTAPATITRPGGRGISANHPAQADIRPGNAQRPQLSRCPTLRPGRMPTPKLLRFGLLYMQESNRLRVRSLGVFTRDKLPRSLAPPFNQEPYDVFGVVVGCHPAIVVYNDSTHRLWLFHARTTDIEDVRSAVLHVATTVWGADDARVIKPFIVNGDRNDPAPYLLEEVDRRLLGELPEPRPSSLEEMQDRWEEFAVAIGPADYPPWSFITQ